MSEELISPKRAAELFGLKEPTVRLWVRTNVVAGRARKPFLVHRGSLLSHIMKDANPKLTQLFSGMVRSGTVPGEEQAK